MAKKCIKALLGIKRRYAASIDTTTDNLEWPSMAASRAICAVAELLVIIRLWHYSYSDQTMTLVIFDQWLVLKCMMFVNAQLVLSQGIGFKQRNALQRCIPATPPWLLSHPCVNFYLHCFCKDDTAWDIFRSKFYEESGLIVALLKTPLLSDPVDTYAEMSRRKHPFNLVHK